MLSQRALKVKVLGCNGLGKNGAVLKGIEWTVNEARRRRRPSVANVSVGSGKSSATNAAVAGTDQHSL
jgi:hypothetical protein